MRRLLPLLLAAGLAAMTFKARAVDFFIDGAVTQTNGGNTLDERDSLTVRKNASITISNNLEAGINIANQNTITNNGAIATSGEFSEGIDMFSRNTITNNGAITTSGDESAGIDGADQNTITNNGAITTSGDDSEGISVTDQNRIINNGAITTSNRSSEGIRADRNNQITNTSNGAITTTGGFSEGIDVSIENTVTNDGIITTTGVEAEGIDVFRENTATNNGTITTSEDSAHGIRARSGNTVRNSKTIITRGSEAYGIKAGDESDLRRNLNNANTVRNSGEITTRGANAAGIWMTNGNTLNHSGRITTLGANAHGIQAANNNTLTLNGQITTAGLTSHGVTTGMDTRLTFGPNSHIKTQAADADGLRIAGLAPAQTRLTHPGHIEAGGTGLRLPWVQRLDNSGSILGINGAGVTFTGTAPGPVTIHNTGTIAGGTYGLDAGNNALARLDNTSNRTLRGGRNAALRAARLLALNNRGTIRSEQASAIQLTGTGAPAATINNSGRIQGHINGLDYGNQSIATLNNTGHIRGTNGIGLKAAGLARLTNRGRIEGQTAIRINRPATGPGTTTTLDNAGILRALTGPSGIALDLQGPGRDTLRLQPGGLIEGRILWDGEDDTLRLATAGPMRLTLTDNNAPANAEPTPFIVQTPAGRPVFRTTARSPQPNQATTTVTVLDPAQTDPRTDATQSLWTGAVFQGLARRQAPADSARRRSLTSAPYHHLWAQPFGGLHTFKREGRTPPARYHYGGAMAGYTRLIEGARFGAFLGAGRSEMTPRGSGRPGQTGPSVEGREVFLGAFGSALWQDLNVSAALVFGESRAETVWRMPDNRATGGRAEVRFEGRHYVLSPELGLATRLTLGGVDFIPALRLRYLGLFNAEARAQSDPTALSLQPEDRHIGLIRMSLGLPLRFPANSYGGQLSGQLRLGAEGQKRLGGETVAVRQGNQSRRYEAEGGQALRGFVGAGFEYAVPALNLGFGLDIEAGYDSRAALGVRGQLGFVWGF